MNKINYQMIAEYLDNHDIIGDKNDVLFDNIKSVLEADEMSLVFIGNNKNNAEILISKTKAKIIIIGNQNNIDFPKDKVFLIVENPKLAFSKIANRYFIKSIDHSIHPSVVIHPEAKIAKNVYIGPNCVIGRGEIQENTVIFGNVFIYDNFIIGKNVKINAGTVIGAEGYGYSREKDGSPVLFPHIGGVIIEDNVDIGSNVSIDRGALSNTIIKKGVKIDNLVHIAHNVCIGENTFVIANATICGSVTIGKNVWVGPNVIISNGLHICDNAQLLIGSVVLNSIVTEEECIGYPAYKKNKFFKNQYKINNL
ncbi:MAG: UDP-3-O-(3-hydroxymyristoyl)glucosamine N-acyltransferase [Bacteroidetes bacterium]|nr:UDP-3-O-(3-hydroxymyristoyl)glucosamine N-acyltransferase [Bacteroidota bacterium]